MEQLVKTIPLKNNLTVELFDASKKIAGERWQVTLVARMAVPVEKAIAESRPDPAKAAEIRQILGETITYEVQKQRNFIDDREKTTVLDQLMDVFIRYTRPYLAHPDFAGRFVLKTFHDRQNRGGGLRDNNIPRLSVSIRSSRSARQPPLAVPPCRYRERPFQYRRLTPSLPTHPMVVAFRAFLFKMPRYRRHHFSAVFSIQNIS